MAFRRVVGRWSGAATRFYSAVPPKGRGIVKVSLLSASGGVLLGLGYSAYTHYDINKKITPVMEPVERKIEALPNFVPTRVINGKLNIMNTEFVLFQYQTCPFCCKVRAFLDFHGFSYSVVEVDAVLRQSIKWSKYKKVPILLVKTNDEYQQLNDSTLIISVLSSYLESNSQNLNEIISFYPSMKYVDENGQTKDEILNKYFLMYQKGPSEESRKKITDEIKWRKWSDEVLVHTLSPNVYRTVNEAYQAFNWFADVGEWRKHFPSWEVSLMINVGAYAMWMIGKKLKKKHNLKEDVRVSLYDECNNWTKEISSRKSTFMGGSSPNLSDLAVFGVLSSIEGCDTFQDLLDNTKIGKWYGAMKTHIDNNKGTVATS